MTWLPSELKRFTRSKLRANLLAIKTVSSVSPHTAQTCPTPRSRRDHDAITKLAFEYAAANFNNFSDCFVTAVFLCARNDYFSVKNMKITAADRVKFDFYNDVLIVNQARIRHAFQFYLVCTTINQGFKSCPPSRQSRLQAAVTKAHYCPTLFLSFISTIYGRNAIAGTAGGMSLASCADQVVSKVCQ